MWFNLGKEVTQYYSFESFHDRSEQQAVSSFLHLGRGDLGTGTILAVFQFGGTICVLTDSWKRWVNIGANCLRQDLSNMLYELIHA